MDILSLLQEQDIAYTKFDHEAVFTVEESDKLLLRIPGAKTKNLFLRDKKGSRHFLVVVPGEKRVDLDALATKLGTSRLSFGSADRLMNYLKILPGSVSLLAVINDTDSEVEVIIDLEVWKEGSVQCHPLINTSTLVLSCEDVNKFLTLTRHEAITLQVPAKVSD